MVLFTKEENKTIIKAHNLKLLSHMITTHKWHNPHKREATQAHLVTNATWLDQELILQGDKNNEHSYLSTRKYLI